MATRTPTGKLDPHRPRHGGNPEESRALDLFVKLLRAADTVTRRTRGVIDRAGLTESRFGVLEALLHLGPLTSGDLSRKILKSPGNLTLVVDNLERDGLVERLWASDRRRRPVALTPRGKTLVGGLMPDHVRGIVEALGVLTPREQATLASLCRKLGLALETDRHHRKHGSKTVGERGGHSS